MITCLSRKNQQQSCSHMCIASETTVWIQGSSRSSSIRGHSTSFHEEHHQTCLRLYGYALSAWEEPKTSYVKLANSKPLRPQYGLSRSSSIRGINIKSTSCKKKYLQVWLKWWWKYSGQIHMLLRHMDGDEQDTLRKQKRSKWTRWCYTTKHLSAPAVWSDDYTGTADSSMHQTAKSCIWRYQASNILASLSTGRGKTGKKGSTTRGNQGLMQFMLYVDSEKSACACKT